MSLHGAYLEDLEPWVYKCEHCGQEFDKKKELRRHIQTHDSRAKA